MTKSLDSYVNLRRPCRAAHSLLLAGVVLLAGCGNKSADEASQVVAAVDGEEITESQVNQTVERQAGLKPDQVEPASRRAVAGLVEQEIVLQKARELKLDRDPRVVQNVESMKREIVVRAYFDRITDGATKPSAKETQAYFDDNPALFKERRVYTFQELLVQASDAQRAEIEGQLKALKSSAELEAFLKAKQIPVRTERRTVGAENVPLPLLQRVSKMNAGQGLIVSADGGLRIVLLMEVQNSPVTEVQARPAINVYLLNQRKRQALERELASLRSGAKVEYFGKYVDLAASAAAAASMPAAASASAALAAQTSTDPK